MKIFFAPEVRTILLSRKFSYLSINPIGVPAGLAAQARAVCCLLILVSPDLGSAPPRPIRALYAGHVTRLGQSGASIQVT